MRASLQFLCVAMLAWFQASPAGAGPALKSVDAPLGAEAWLVTFGPGELYWERFGHNAIWLREPAAGIDHTFNFGFFDFEQQDFLLRFMRGRMLYFSVAQPADREFEYYRKVNRSIRAQKLNLAPSGYQRLRDHLLHEIKPENRDYRYDYYLDNCSTRIRDALDIALGGALSARAENKPAVMNFRAQTRRLTQTQFWYYLGLELALGYPVDRPISRWDEMFIPMVIAEEIADMPLPASDSGSSLVSLDTMLFKATAPLPAAQPSAVWYRYLLFGLLVIGVAWAGGFMPPVWLHGLCNAWLLISATSGLVLAALWWLTDHAVASPNANLLLCNPLVILALAPALRKLGAVVLAGGVVICLLMLLLPVHQYNIDALALLAPINIGVAVYLFKPGSPLQRPLELSGTAVALNQ